MKPSGNILFCGVGGQGILLASEDVGGPAGRTVHFELVTGAVRITSNGSSRDL